MRNLPREDIKVVIHPRGGLNTTKLGAVVVADAILAATSNISDDLDQDTLCLNTQRNITVASTPRRENAGRRGEYLRPTHSKSPTVPPLDLVLEENLQFPTTSSEMETVSRGRSRSRDRSRLRGHSKSRGHSRSWATARSWSSARSKTGSSSTRRPQKPALSWASKVRGDDVKPAESSRSPSKQSGLLHYVYQLESLRKENALLCIGNAQVKEVMKKTASEIAEIKKFALRQASDPSPEPIAMEVPEASTSRSGASKRRAKECKQSNATDKTLAAMEDVLSAMQSSLKKKKTDWAQ
ncbi:hypothetical protein HPB51_020910 [Rhipicephalus microplus]|uniref:Uncharacterized protein n=1 Tax=Rhipicephalus microplus TaxID=6941 RepID=A0A9J6EPX9_RHIMP|nr:hypothetical protein HPB51_020910 [Rhipicephalus microplus]